MASGKDRFDIDFTPLRDFMRQMDTFFSQSFKHLNSQFNIRPFWVDVKETRDYYIIEAELAGYSRDQIRIETFGNRLRISIEESTSLKGMDDKETTYSNQETFRRRERIVTLPIDIPEEETEASYKNGVLTIKIPKDHAGRKFIDIQE